MASEPNQESLKRITSVTELLKSARAASWLATFPAAEVTNCLRKATGKLRQELLSGTDVPEISPDHLLDAAEQLLLAAARPAVRVAINATGIILHTGLGRAVFPPQVVDSLVPELKGYCTLAVHPDTGERVERDELVEQLLVRLTGAEAATVVNNNAAATLLVLSALATNRQVIVSRGQLIEIGGSFRLPEVMAQSHARLAEVGATNRTHLRDYEQAIGPETAALMRVHPSNYRIVGFTSQPELPELAALAHRRGLLLIDDLGAGALVDLKRFGLPAEPTVAESIRAGADVVLFSGDKLIGASQSGIIVGREDLVRRLRKHPLMRALRVDKTCLMVLERTLRLFLGPEQLIARHPLYQMICEPLASLHRRAERLREALTPCGSRLTCVIQPAQAFLGSGSLPTEAIPSVAVALECSGLGADSLARHLRLDENCVFGRIEGGLVLLDMRTVTDPQIPLLAQAIARSILPTS